MANLCLSVVFLLYSKQYQTLPEPVKIFTVPVIAIFRCLPWLKLGKINTRDPKSFVTENRYLFQQPAGI